MWKHRNDLCFNNTTPKNNKRYDTENLIHGDDENKRASEDMGQCLRILMKYQSKHLIFSSLCQSQLIWIWSLCRSWAHLQELLMACMQSQFQLANFVLMLMLPKMFSSGVWSVCCMLCWLLVPVMLDTGLNGFSYNAVFILSVGISCDAVFILRV